MAHSVLRKDAAIILLSTLRDVPSDVLCTTLDKQWGQEVLAIEARACDRRFGSCAGSTVGDKRLVRMLPFCRTSMASRVFVTGHVRKLSGPDIKHVT